MKRNLFLAMTLAGALLFGTLATATLVSSKSTKELGGGEKGKKNKKHGKCAGEASSCCKMKGAGTASTENGGAATPAAHPGCCKTSGTGNASSTNGGAAPSGCSGAKPASCTPAKGACSHSATETPKP